MKTVTIPKQMLLDLCNDANWKAEEFNNTIRVFNRFHGNDYAIKQSEIIGK